MTSTPSSPAELTALVEEACRKAGLVWVNGQAVWHVWGDGGLSLVCGGADEQPVPPGLVDGGDAEVVVRSKDKGARLVTWRGRAEVLDPASEAWASAVAELRGKRLNAVDAEGVPERWARECSVFRVSPEGVPVERPGAMPDGSGAAVPPPCPAVTRRPMPAGLPKLLARRKRA